MVLMKKWVIIPAHNEEKNINKVIKKVKKYNLNIIVVDDGSTDKTFDVASKLDIIVLKHEKNFGKGIALRTGCDYAISKGAEILIVLDSDGQHKPKDIPKFIKQLTDKDIVLSFRKFSKRMPLIFRFGNKLITTIILLFYGISVKDSQSGFRALTAETYKKIRWKSEGYSVESEMLCRIGKNKLKYTEIPIDTVYSDKFKGTTALDGIKIIADILLWRIRLNG